MCTTSSQSLIEFFQTTYSELSTLSIQMPMVNISSRNRSLLMEVDLKHLPVPTIQEKKASKWTSRLLSSLRCVTLSRRRSRKRLNKTMASLSRNSFRLNRATCSQITEGSMTSSLRRWRCLSQAMEAKKNQLSLGQNLSRTTTLAKIKTLTSSLSLMERESKSLKLLFIETLWRIPTTRKSTISQTPAAMTMTANLPMRMLEVPKSTIWDTLTTIGICEAHKWWAEF